jgi:DNA-binding CsgD family transcriptional regulator
MRSTAVRPDSNAVLVLDVDALSTEREAASARCDVRLVGLARPGNGARPDPSAVLVLRALTRTRLLTCIRALARDGGSISPEMLCRMLGEPPEPDAQLTRRELEVLRLLADGDTTREIAERLCYSERTVKNIVRDLLLKLNGRTRAHAVALATRRGMI